MQRVIVFMLCATLAACGGGSSSLPPSTSVNNIVPLKKSGLARFTITIPARSAQNKLRNPKYISVNTQSIIVSLNTVNGATFSGPQAETAANLTPSNPACTGTPLTCSVAVPAAVGTDVFTVNTYDAVQTSTSPPIPAGNLLSTGTVNVSIIAGVANAPSTPLVLDGVPASVTAMLPSDQHIAAVAGGYSVVGTGTYPLTVAVLDASGAQIIGASTPTFTVASPSSAVVLSSTASNSYTMQVLGFSSTPVSLAISPTTGTAPTGAVAITPIQELWVANYSGASVTAFALTSSPWQVTDDTIPISGGCHPTSVAMDATGNVWVAVGETGITGYSLGTSPSLISGSGFMTLALSPMDIAFDASGDLWAADLGGDVESWNVPPLVNPSADISAWTMPNGTISINDPTALAFDSSGKLWVANSLNPNVTAYTIPPHPIPADTIPQISSNVPNYGMAFDSSGHIWISNWNNGTVTEYTPGSTTIMQAITSLSAPEGIAFDFNGNLWVTNSVGGFTSTGTMQEYAAGLFTSPPVASFIAGINGPDGIAIAP